MDSKFGWINEEESTSIFQLRAPQMWHSGFAGIYCAATHFSLFQLEDHMISFRNRLKHICILLGDYKNCNNQFLFVVNCHVNSNSLIDYIF
jgi:hypothetical protein